MNDKVFFAILVLTAGTIFFIIRREIKNWNIWLAENEPVGFYCLDEIIDAKRWVGSELIMHKVLTRPIKNLPPSVFCREYLCQSKNGEYITIMVILDAKRKICHAESRQVLDEQGARRWLEHDKEAYIAVFGAVEKA